MLEGLLVTVTAYVALAQYTDDTPCLAARNYNVCEAQARGEKICAANFVPLGTKLWVEGYGECTVRDRLNRRYKNRVDILMNNIKEAKTWGIRKKLIKIIK